MPHFIRMSKPKVNQHNKISKEKSSLNKIIAKMFLKINKKKDFFVLVYFKSAEFPRIKYSPGKIKYTCYLHVIIINIRLFI